MRIELQPIGFNGFMAGGTNTVGTAWQAAEGSIDLPQFFMIPPHQTVEKPHPILIGEAVHPLGVLFDLNAFPLQVLKGCLNALTTLPKPLGTGGNV
jgi:hypothetical protein